jgi:hypothetical protein
MSDRGDLTEPMDELPERRPAPPRRQPSNWLGNTIAILLVLAIGALMAGGAVRAFLPTPLRGATGATPSPSPTVPASPTFTPRPLPTFTVTPSPTPAPTPSPTPTRTVPPKPTPTPIRTTPPPTVRTTPPPTPTRTP